MEEYQHDEEYDEELAMWNAYFFLMGDFSVHDIIEKGEEGIFFPFNPVDYTREEVQEVIDWFAARDKFEECIELKIKKESLIK